ncbi:Protein of unknown function [Cotesia congregata]|uniref:Uncharacterized protein n=1 Tax=Cotesia congregata TaxID=51543 RepID=A0A8J2HES9_COTCN|nr:Protein of unknown function [Cotesia congregata]
MIGELCPSWVPNNRPCLVSDIADPFLDSTFTKEELSFALADVKLSSSPGLDGIDYKMIVQLPNEAKLVLLELLNQIFTSQDHQNTNTAIERVKEAMDDVCSYLDSLGLDLSVKKTQFCIFDKRNGRKVNSPKWNITVRGAAWGYSSSTPCNVILAEAKEPPLDIRFRYLASNFLARAASRIDHKVLLVLQEVADLEDTPTLINRDGRVNLVVSFREIDKYRHLIMSSNGPLCYEYGFESIMHHPQVSFDEGEEINGSKRCQELFRDIFDEFLTSWTCIFTDGSKDDKAPFGGFSVVLPLEEVELEFRAPRQASIFTLEVMAIYHALKFIEQSPFRCFTPGVYFKPWCLTKWWVKNPI